METIGKKIKRLRIEQNMTQDELAKKVGYTSRSTVNKIEIDEIELNQTKIVAFAKALNTSVAYLMGWEDKKTTDDLKHNTIIASKNGFDKKIYNLSESDFNAIVTILDNFNNKE